jgi:hypothetical protein
MCCTFKFNYTHKVVKVFRLVDYPSPAIEQSLEQELLHKTGVVIGEDLKVTHLSGMLFLAIK